ncbi:unnamed protein product [Dovyalis caffra]|uniref:Uncharacterized protein n=1 Tax=Dovyalis caffra TaxID=77055 RepID=A0AAV1S8D5_9ROSI|nr:unnamed protein product [Dovyalis caffra]
MNQFPNVGTFSFASVEFEGGLWLHVDVNSGLSWVGDQAPFGIHLRTVQVGFKLGAMEKEISIGYEDPLPQSRPLCNHVASESHCPGYPWACYGLDPGSFPLSFGA